MHFKKLSQLPLPPVPDGDFPDCGYVYMAEVVESKQDGRVLALTVFKKDRHSRQDSGIYFAFRHFFSGKDYVTQNADGSKGNGALGHYIAYYLGKVLPVSEADDLCIKDFFKEKSLEIKPELPDRKIHLLRRTVGAVETKLLDERLAIRHKKETDVIDERMELVNAELPEGFDKWLDSFIFKAARYFFYSYAKGKKQQGYCSYCKSTFSAAVKHGDKVACPHCKSVLKAAALGKTTKHRISEQKDVVVMEPHPAENLLILRELTAYHSISRHHDGADAVKVEISTIEAVRAFHDLQSLASVIDKRGCSSYIYAEYKQTGKIRWCSLPCYPEGWIFPGTLPAVVAASSAIKSKNVDYCKIAEVSPFRAQGFFSSAVKYPCLENLAKLGFVHLSREVANRAQQRYTYYSEDRHVQSLKLEKASVKDMLGVDKVTAEHFREIDITSKQVALYKRYCMSLPWELAKDVIELFSDNAVALGRLLDYRGITPQRAVNYVKKQMKACKVDKDAAITLWADYLSMCGKAHIKLTDDIVIFPKSIEKEHGKVSELIYLRENEKANRALAARAKKLAIFEYADKKYLIRPLRTVGDFQKESDKLRHCVKTYADRCSKGKTNIFGIREVDKPDLPFFTLELSNAGEVIQNRGLNNGPPPEGVKKFVKKWLAECVEKNLPEFIGTKKNRVRKGA